MTDNPLSRIRKFIVNRFRSDELYRFNFDYFADFLPEVSEKASLKKTAQELIEYCKRKEQISRLIEKLENERPVAFKNDFPDKEELLRMLEGKDDSSEDPQPIGPPIQPTPPDILVSPVHKNKFQEILSLPTTTYLPGKICQSIPDQEKCIIGDTEIIRVNNANKSISVRVRNSNGDRHARPAQLKLEKTGVLSISAWHDRVLPVNKSEINNVYEVKDWPTQKHVWYVERLAQGICIEFINGECYQFLEQNTLDVWRIEHRAAYHLPDKYIIWFKLANKTEGKTQ